MTDRIRMIEAGELEVAAQYARAHNKTCSFSIKNSGEDGKPYCRYRIETTESGIGLNLYLVCIECEQSRHLPFKVHFGLEHNT